MRLPEGICSPPKALYPAFALGYNTTIEDQENLQQKNDQLLSDALLYLEKNPLKNAHDLMKLMCFVLAKYKLPKNTPFEPFFEKIQRQNNPFHKKYERQNNSMQTRFDEASERKLTNYFVFEHTHQIMKQTNQKYFLVNVNHFCNDAKKYLGIPLKINKKARSMKIAELLFYTNRNTNEIYFKHRYHFLGANNESKPQYLFSLYNQLIAIIFKNKHSRGGRQTRAKGFEENEDARYESNTNDDQSKILDAIFLLVFLIGSNPAMYYEKDPNDPTEVRCTGGGFVTDALLQLLLVKSGFKPIKKNYLNLVEIELLLYYSLNSRSESKVEDARKYPRKSYYDALWGKTTLLFHPDNDVHNQELLSLAFKMSFEKNQNDALFLLAFFLSSLFKNKKRQSEFLAYLDENNFYIRKAMVIFISLSIKTMLEIKTLFSFKTLTTNEYHFLLSILNSRLQRFRFTDNEIGYLCSKDFLEKTSLCDLHKKAFKDFFAVTLFRENKSGLHAASREHSMAPQK